MKRILIALLAMTLCFGASATAIDEVRPLEGEITAVTDEGFLINDLSLGEVYVLFSDDTAFEGVAARDAMAVGQYVYVQYDGRMTRSLPPQVSADKVSCFAVVGTVAEILENGFLVTGDETLGDVIIHTDETMPHAFAGVPVTVYYDGVMATSYPAQIGARKLVVPMVTGTIETIADDMLTLTDADGARYEALLTDDTRRECIPAEGMVVTVLYDGKLTRSIPAQLTALEIVAADVDATCATVEGA